MRVVPRALCSFLLSDQGNIDASLAALPIFLQGCRTLLVLSGPTYFSRLWCVMEVFIFMRVKDDGATAGSTQLARQLLTVKFVGDNAHLMWTLSRFDAAKAQCRYDRDRQKLLAVIESSFGTTAPFNQLVREVLNARVLGLKEVSRHKGRTGLTSTESDVVVV